MLSAAIGLAFAFFATPSPAVSADDYFTVEKLATGVYGVIRKEPPGLAVDCNVTFIIDKKSVVVVDANIGPESAGATIRALKKITNKPVRYLINTHYHDDHIGGDSTFRAAYPGIKFIGQTTTRANLKKYAAASRKSMIETAPQMTGFLQQLIDKKKGFSGGPITEEERVTYLSDIRLANRYAKEMPKIAIVEPDIEVKDRLTLKVESRRIVVLHLGSGHTGSDLVVWLPNEHIAVTGDLIVWPVPMVGAPQSHVDEWPGTLQKVLDLHPSIFLPGHGPVLRNAVYPKLLIRMFTSINKQVAAAIRRGEKLPAVRKSVDLSKFEKVLVGESHMRKTLFDLYCREPSIKEAFEEQAKTGR
jgi:cyclase